MHFIILIVHIHKKYRIVFKAEADPEVDWEFEPVHDEVIVNAGETALIFYRAHNKEADPVIGKKNWYLLHTLHSQILYNITNFLYLCLALFVSLATLTLWFNLKHFQYKYRFCHV